MALGSRIEDELCLEEWYVTCSHQELDFLEEHTPVYGTILHTAVYSFKCPNLREQVSALFRRCRWRVGAPVSPVQNRVPFRHKGYARGACYRRLHQQLPDRRQRLWRQDPSERCQE